MDKPTETRQGPRRKAQHLPYENGQDPEGAGPPQAPTRGKLPPRRTLGLLLVLGLLLLGVGTAATTCLSLPRRESHGTDEDDMSYWQSVWIGACQAQIRPKEGPCVLKNIDGMTAWTKGTQTCWDGARFTDRTDWRVEDTGLNISQASAAGSADLEYPCRDAHIWEWTFSAGWVDDGDILDEWGGYDSENRDY